jgi:hypothetical protein
MAQCANVDGLASSLLAIVNDPARIGALYDVLREYCHQSRNFLNSLKLSLYLAKRSACPASVCAWDKLEQEYRDVEMFLERLQLICRPMPLTPMTSALCHVLEERRAAWTHWLSSRGRTLELVAPKAAVTGRFDPARLTQGLDALAAWRARGGEPGTTVRLEWRARGEEFVLNWDEPGGTIIEPEAGIRHRPDCLALPLMARIIAAHGGKLAIAYQHGLQVRLRWPREVGAAVTSGIPSTE